MNHRRVAALVATATLSCCGLSGCTPGTPVAYHVTAGTVDIAFCDTFTADSVVISFVGPAGEPASPSGISASGESADFGNGVPVSVSMENWVETPGSEGIPSDWARVDYEFSADGDYAGEEYLFRRDVGSSGWGWTSGFNVASPSCELQLESNASR
ncbi:hypothetical protein [Protaetiibacter intestinalis]|uniref:Lipoprotein n=1 Tax=Protaetiibacter intestinalis TaxID=2419774 RepID=A0A387B8M2_9MICO|nr:hypothetical protein [Protaetiibacter intestinalis]AYF98707.1 hypothetical protein D7I47_10895 [Protaetiibacter intestinalis]